MWGGRLPRWGECKKGRIAFSNEKREGKKKKGINRWRTIKSVGQLPKKIETTDFDERAKKTEQREAKDHTGAFRASKRHLEDGRASKKTAGKKEGRSQKRLLNQQTLGKECVSVIVP